MFLNTLDLCACTSTVIAVTFRVIRRGSPDQQIIGKIADVTESLYLISIEATGFTTLLLSIARCISVSSPLYNIRKFYVAISATLYISYTTVREIAFWLIWLTDENYYKQILPIHAAFVLGGIGLMVILVVLTNSISIIYIIKGTNIADNSRENAIQATVTVAILSACFCLLNTFHVVSSVIHFYLSISGSESWRNFALEFGIFYAVPLNSALNPLIYLFRKKDMRQALLDLFRIPFRRSNQVMPINSIPVKSGEESP